MDNFEKLMDAATKEQKVLYRAFDSDDGHSIPMKGSPNYLRPCRTPKCANIMYGKNGSVRTCTDCGMVQTI